MTTAALATEGARIDRPEGSPAAGVWWARLLRVPGGHERSLVAVHSDRYPDGATMELDGVVPPGRWPAGWLVDVRHRVADGAVLGVEVAERVAAPREDVWFAEVFHATSSIPAVSLLAFAGRAFPPGAVVTPYHVAARGVAMRSRIGEARWWTRSGVVDTVTVEPQARGQGLGTVLVTVAEALCTLRGWASLRSDERLHASGAGWLAKSPPYWHSRIAGEQWRDHGRYSAC